MASEPKITCAGGAGLSGLAQNRSGSLFAASSEDGAVLQQDGDELLEWTNTGGQPSDVAFDPVSDRMYVADLAHAAVLLAKDDGSLQLVVKEYEGVSFKGPSSVAFSASGSLFFTDSGPLGETTLQDPTGSCFAITGPPDGQVLRPLALGCLAHPSGVAVSPSGTAVYVAELLRNRVLRFVERPTGVYHMSVFYQFSGRMGPSALACDADGNLYVARFDFAEVADEGVISVLNSAGEHQRDFTTPGAEVSGLAVSADGKTLLASEASTNTVSRFDLK